MNILPNDIRHQIRITRIIDRNLHNAHALIRQRLLHDALQITGLLDLPTPGTERLRKLDEVDAAELDTALAPVLGHLLDGDHVVLAVVPDEVRDVAPLLHCRAQLLRREHEPAVA